MNFSKLTKTPDEMRDILWEDTFLQLFVDQTVGLMSPESESGPDGFPYMFVTTANEIKKNQELNYAMEPAQNIIQWSAERGIGIVINPNKKYPDFILTYGMLWHFRKTGRFIVRNQTEAGPIVLDKSKLSSFGPPSENYLPTEVRKFLKQFLLDQGILAPKFLVLSQDNKNFDFAFSLESFKNPPEKEWSGIAEALAWFLPTHYSILLMSENGWPEFTLV